MPALESRIMNFCWSQNPDLALEAGFIPSSLWEDLGRNGISEEAEQLLAEVEQSDLSLQQKLSARYHLACASLAADRNAISLLNHMTGPAARLAWAASSWPIASDESGRMYTEGLREFPSYCSAVLNAIQAQGESHACRSVLEAFIEQATAIVDANGNGRQMLLLPLAKARASSESIQLPSADVIDDVLSGLQKLTDAARKALPSAHWSSPLARLPEGSSRYARAIYFGTSLPASFESIQILGYRLLGRSEHRFRELRTAQTFKIDDRLEIGELFSRFLTTYGELHRRLPAVVRSLPVMECEVVPMPRANAAVGPPAYYGPSSMRNNRKGALYVNMEEPSVTRSWEILPLAMHEGVPGHHLQLALLDENEQIGVLNRWLSVNAFTEGWAVYAETLGSAIDLDVTPQEEFGLLAHQRWRAARLVVEIGLHVHGWSVAEATAFIARHSFQNETAARREVVRYLSWPGQALGYAVGSEAIASWVRDRQSHGVPLNSAHQELLEMGSVPLSILVPQTGDGEELPESFLAD
jgi:uncharacterized protein (DUF885 family)